MSALAKPARTRRTFLGTLAILPFFGAVGTSFFARKADAASLAVMDQIKAAELRCHATKKAFDDAVAAFEAAIPELPPCLDMTDCRPRPFRSAIERRSFDGETVKRGAFFQGIQQHRYIATVATLNQDLEWIMVGEPGWRRRDKAIRLMRRRAARYEMTIMEAEKAHELLERERDHEQAKRAFSELGHAIFAKPAETNLGLQAQARMLSAYLVAINEQYATAQAGRWGDTLATSVLSDEDTRMSATIIPFRSGRASPLQGATPTPFTREWQEQHLPLIDAAMELLQADDAEFQRRCQTIAETEGSTMLEHLTAQLDRLSGHVGDVVEALAMTAMRIRTTMAGTPGQPA